MKIFLNLSYTILFLFIGISPISCDSSKSDISQITYQTSLSDFLITVEGEGELDARRSQTLVVPRVRAQPIIAYLAPEGKIVKKGEIVVKLEAEEIIKNYGHALEEVEIAHADADKKDAELNLQKLLLLSQLKNAEASAATARLQSTKLEFEALAIQEIKKLEIAEYELEVERNQKKLISLEKIQAEERAHVQMKIRQAENKVKQSKRFLDMLTLTTPIDGVLVYERNWRTGEKVQVGDMLYSNMPVVKVPNTSSMQVNIRIGETEAQKIKIGQVASIHISSLGGLSFSGKVSHLATMATSVRRGSKVKKVEVHVDVDSTAYPLVPGLSARCIIEIETISNTIKVPKECIFEKDSIKIVYVKKGNSFTPYPVQIIKENENFVVLDSDLSGGEQCTLREPNSSKVKWPKNFRVYRKPANIDSAKFSNYLAQ